MTNSIDLVPADYRKVLNRRHHLHWTGLAVVTICLVVAGMSALTAHRAHKLRLDSNSAKHQQTLTALYRDQVAELDERLTRLDEEWLLLRGLRSGLAVEELFVMVDQALPGSDVWFTNWSFRRAGVVIPEPPAGVETGYFVVVSDLEKTQDDPSWRVETHMNIVGQAKDHAALSKFVRGLYKHQQIDSVKLNQTRIREYANRSVVDFELAVVLFSEPAV